MYGEHIEEMYKLFLLSTAKNKIKAADVASDVIEILYSQGEITYDQADDPKFIADLTENVKYICNLSR